MPYFTRGFQPLTALLTLALPPAALLTAACLLPCAGVHAQSPPPTGTLTGVVMSSDGKVVQNVTTLLAGGAFVNIIRHDSAFLYFPGDGLYDYAGPGKRSRDSRTTTDLQHGGLYTFSGLAPGVYDVLVEAGHVPSSSNGTDTDYRPQRIWGVIVRPGKETDLDITLHPGDRNNCENTGTPTLPAAKYRKFGWVEGTVRAADGHAVLSATTLLASGVNITFRKVPGGAATLETDLHAGGFFAIVNAPPGVYDVTVDKGVSLYSQADHHNYRPLILRHVVIAPGVLTRLDIRMHDGDALERVTAPAGMNSTVADTAFSTKSAVMRAP